jgi:spermidine synthase
MSALEDFPCVLPSTEEVLLEVSHPKRNLEVAWGDHGGKVAMNQGGHNQRADRIALTLALVGFFVQFGQVLTFREIVAATHATELLVGSVFAFWLIWGAIGAFAGGRLVSNETSVERTCDLLTLSWALSSLLAVVQILLLRLVPWMPHRGTGQFMPLARCLSMVAVGVAPLSFLGGFQVAIVFRAMPKDWNRRLFRAAAWGAMLGGLATVSWFSAYGHSAQNALIWGAILFALVGRILQRPYSLATEKLSIALIGIMLTAALTIPLDRWSEGVRWTYNLPGYKLSKVEDTRYGRLAVLKDQSSSKISVFQNGSMAGRYEESVDDPAARDLSILIGLQHLAPARVLFIGGALSRLPQYMLRHEPQQLSVIGLDPALFPLARNAGLLPLGDSRLSSLAGDARLLVKRAPAGFWDLVVMVLPEPDNVGVNRYCTMEFFADIKRIMRPDGVICLLLPSYGVGAEHINPLLARRSASVLAAMARVFAFSRAVPIGGHLFVATNKAEQISFDPDILTSRLRARKEITPWSEVVEHGQVLRRLLDPSEVPAYFGTVFGGILSKKVSSTSDSYGQSVLARFEALLLNTPAEVNRDARPIGVLCGFNVSQRWAYTGKEGPWAGWLLGFLDSITTGNLGFPWTLVVTVLVLTIAGFIRARWASEESLAPGTILIGFATGTFGIVAMISLLFMHQNLNGYVYTELGILCAAFMGGLSLGSFVAERSKSRIASTLFCMLLLLISVCLFAPPIFQWVSSLAVRGWLIRSTTGTLAAISGMGVGTIFPLLVALNAERGRYRLGAWFYATNLAVSSAVSIISSAFLIPTLGIAKVLHLEALLLMLALACLVIGAATKELLAKQSSQTNRQPS